MTRTTQRHLLAAAVLACGSLIAGCTAAEVTHDGRDGGPTTVEEHRTPTPRLVIAYDGGLRIVDATTLEQVADLPKEGFLRLNAAGDSRSVLVTADDGFTVLDAGTWGEKHGDHSHYRTTEPSFTGATFKGSEPGHVVSDGDRTTLFFDGTGEVRVVDPRELGAAVGSPVDYVAPHPHHGIAVARPDGTMVVTRGTEEARTGVAILDTDRTEVASTSDCPGVHGEALAADGVLTVGCENGIVIVRGGEIRKVAAPDSYGRIGNQRGSGVSSVILGDYKTQRDLPEGQIERPTRFSLTDTATGELRIVDLPTSYSFRSLARGPNGEAMVLGTDGRLYVYDQDTGQLIAAHQVIEPWQEPTRWQDAMPAVEVLGDTAYISDPENNQIRVVAIDSGHELVRADVGVRPVETVVVSGGA
ncbi:hypothetical protein [Gordonia sp. (in: high G+C Gram-positive bacteria)]|uniref:hypothetical protein n=1 Tax=Gordonia sp. (in: high G+C Gram-positive bacteria) TaxID=84139 RepID=UPI0016B9C3E6|nr:hypothetical protein [Gordonia sp. (in: high G+C Gram-positive bacteria)]NLG48463.1 hypothetical protein [Gordonia sp. (in: high G+C Gram-positive bacteria)]